MKLATGLLLSILFIGFSIGPLFTSAAFASDGDASDVTIGSLRPQLDSIIFLKELKHMGQFADRWDKQGKLITSFNLKRVEAPYFFKGECNIIGDGSANVIDSNYGPNSKVKRNYKVSKVKLLKLDNQFELGYYRNRNYEKGFSKASDLIVVGLRDGSANRLEIVCPFPEFNESTSVSKLVDAVNNTIQVQLGN